MMDKRLGRFFMLLSVFALFVFVSCKDGDDGGDENGGSINNLEEGNRGDENKQTEDIVKQDIWNMDLITSDDLMSVLGNDTLVDMGLEVKWANFNVGASMPYEYGYYLSWGESAPKSAYRSTYLTDKSTSFMKSEGIVVTGNGRISSNGISDCELTSKYDAVSINWGGKYRMPSSYDISCLIKSSLNKWVAIRTEQGKIVKGLLVKSVQNGNMIFLPADGIMKRDGKNFDVQAGCGYYWSSSCNQLYDGGTYYYTSDYMFFQPNGFERKGMSMREYGMFVRPVSEK